MKDQMENLQWDACVFVRSLESLEIQVHSHYQLGNKGGVNETTKLFIHGIKEENINVKAIGPQITIQITGTMIQTPEVSWEIWQDWAPNISIAGYSDVETESSDLSFSLILDASPVEARKRLHDLKLETVNAQLNLWEPIIKHSKDPIYVKYHGLGNESFKREVEQAISKQIAAHFTEKSRAKLHGSQVK